MGSTDFGIARISKDYEIIWNNGLQDCEDFEGLQNISNDDFPELQNNSQILRDYKGVHRLPSFLYKVVL